MEGQQNQIGMKEYVAIAFFLIVIKATDDIPTILFESLQNAGWVGPLLGGITAIVPLCLLIHLAQKYEGENAVDIFYHLLGRSLGFIVLFFLWGAGFIYIVLDTAVYADIISTMYFVRTPAVVLYVILIAVSAYGVKKGLVTIGSVARAVFPYLQASLLFALILTLVQGKHEYLFPLWGPGKMELIKEGMLSVSIYVDFLYLFFIFPFVKSAKDYKRGTWIAFFLILLNITISLISYIALFDYRSAALLNYPYHEAIRTITIGLVGGVETFLFPFWLIAADIKFAIYFYLNIFLFSQLFKIKHFEYMIPSFATLILFLGLIPESPTFSIFKIDNGLFVFIKNLRYNFQ